MDNFVGYVTGVSNGVVSVLLDPETEKYPEVGTSVVVTSIKPEPPKPLQMKCYYCLMMAPKEPNKPHHIATMFSGTLVCGAHFSRHAQVIREGSIRQWR